MAIKLRTNLLYNQSGEEHETQIVPDSMYKHNDHYLKFCIPQHSIVLTIQKVNYVGLTFYKNIGDVVVKTYLLVFYDQQSTQNHKENVDSMNEAFWTRR